jgi:N-acetylneuraminic acid mutarotase
MIVALSSAINLPNKRPKVPAPENSTAVGVNGQESAGSAGAPAIRTERTLTFADRVTYQRAIEEVYWRHRIWPAANAAPKPPLDKVMSQAQIEKKVEDYLRDSQALEDYWQRPITPDQLQAEMERIASHTKQPGVLREVFAALGNDPFVIAECLARPVLAERLLTELYAHDQRFHGELKRRAEAELKTHRSLKQMKQTNGMYTEMEWIKSDSTDPVAAGVPPAQLTLLPPQKSDDEKRAPAVKMNSSEWQENVGKLARDFGNAKSGNAIAQIKTGVLSPLQEDDAHYYAVAVMNKGKDRLKLATIAWLKEPLRSWLAKAEAQVPVTMAAVSANYTLPVISSPTVGCTDDTWAPSSMNAPIGRANHTAVWTGSEMIVWGGENLLAIFGTGGRYDPITDAWTATSLNNNPFPRTSHTAVWTGTEMIVWGGFDGSDGVNTGGRYNPSTDSWISTSILNAPSARDLHTAVWTGTQMIVWGGYGAGSDGELNTGGRYNPSTNTWTATSTTNAPSARYFHTAVWTGSEMIVWGGYDFGNNLSFDTGGRYNPNTNTWTPTSTTNAPVSRHDQTAVWTGAQMIVWGGIHQTSNAFDYLYTGGRYNPTTDTWAATAITNVPVARYHHSAVWTGSVMIIWAGNDYNTGGRYNPITDSWTATSTTNAPSRRWRHTAIWTGAEMIVWGGGGHAESSSAGLTSGGRYNPGTDTWTTTNRNAPNDARWFHTAVWTGSEMIIWGGYNGSELNTGGQYHPSTDSWTSTSLLNAPSARSFHTAVWSGTEMIVWGGFDGFLGVNTGGRYNPGTDSWTATSTTNAPAGRSAHTAVWAGGEMIGWGGQDADGNMFNTGGRYDPSTNSWAATSTTGAPAAREYHTAVWTGSEMIVWGGAHATITYFNTGGRYKPGTDTWTATSTTNAPSARYYHTAVWTGNQMIVWGGYFYDGSEHWFNTGGRYNPGTNSWIPTSTINAPVARTSHRAVWTGGEMIVWGGSNGFGYPYDLDSGGRYNPSTNSWTSTSLLNAPCFRGLPTAVWTGSEMIVWGGHSTAGGELNTGGRYCAQGGPSPTPTPTPTPTASPTPTPTPTPCIGRCSPTPRLHPTPAPRPSGHPVVPVVSVATP